MYLEIYSCSPPASFLRGIIHASLVGIVACLCQSLWYGFQNYQYVGVVWTLGADDVARVGMAKVLVCVAGSGDSVLLSEGV